MSFKMFPGKFMTSTRNQSERRSCLITWGRVFTYEHPKAGKNLETARPHYSRKIWKRSFISTVRPTVHTYHESRKQSFSKTLFKQEEF